MSGRPDRILWVDIETTGSDEQTDLLLEVACILTDDKLVELSRRSQVIGHHDTVLVRRRAEANTVVREMHDANGLWEVSREAGYDRTVERAERNLREWLAVESDHAKKVALAGSGAGHFDGRWLRYWMPELMQRVTYWAYDVGVMRRWFQRLDLATPSFNDNKTHRAMDDIELHVQEARYYDEALLAAAQLEGSLL